MPGLPTPVASRSTMSVWWAPGTQVLFADSLGVHLLLDQGTTVVDLEDSEFSPGAYAADCQPRQMSSGPNWSFEFTLEVCQLPSYTNILASGVRSLDAAGSDSDSYQMVDNTSQFQSWDGNAIAVDPSTVAS